MLSPVLPLLVEVPLGPPAELEEEPITAGLFADLVRLSPQMEPITCAQGNMPRGREAAAAHLARTRSSTVSPAKSFNYSF